MKLDENGNIQWQKIYGQGYFTSMQQTEDKGYIVGGHYRNISILKLDENGNIQWQKTYYSAGEPTYGFSSIQQTLDGGYIFAGKITYFTEDFDFNSYPWVVKLDASGNIQWQKAYECNPSEYFVISEANDIMQTPDKGYILAGKFKDGFLLLKLDANGNIQF